MVTGGKGGTRKGNGRIRQGTQTKGPTTGMAAMDGKRNSASRDDRSMKRSRLSDEQEEDRNTKQKHGGLGETNDGDDHTSAGEVTTGASDKGAAGITKAWIGTARLEGAPCTGSSEEAEPSNPATKEKLTGQTEEDLDEQSSSDDDDDDSSRTTNEKVREQLNRLERMFFF